MWWQDGTAQGSSALMPWDELHMTLLSSFVPELSPASAGFFLWGRAGKRPEAAQQARCSQTRASASKMAGKVPVQRGPAGVKPCVRGREETEFAVYCRPSWSRCPACSPHRAVRGAPARCRPRSAGRLRGPDGSWLSRGWFEPWLSPFRAFVHARARPYTRARGQAGPLPRDGELRSDGVAASYFKSLGILVWHDSLPKFFLVSRPSQPPCDTRHEEAPAAFAGASN